MVDYVSDVKKSLILEGASINNPFENCALQLRIQMPTGEIETIINPNIKAKIEYINRAYDEDLRLRTCPDIYIVSYTID